MRYPVMNLGQQRNILFPEEMKPFSDEDFAAIEALKENASLTVQGVCHEMHWYNKGLQAKSSVEMNRAIKNINKRMDEMGDKEKDLWIYILAYCTAPAGIMDALHAMRKKEHPTKFTPRIPEPPRPITATPGGVKPAPTGGVIPARPTQLTPRGRSSVTTPSSMRTTPIAPQAQLPTYMDVQTPSAPLRYGTDLERQIESYTQKLKEFSERPATPTQYAGIKSQAEIEAEAKARHEEWMRRAGMQPGTPVATQSTNDPYNLTKKFAPQSNQYNLTPPSMRPKTDDDCPPGQSRLRPGEPCRPKTPTGGIVSQALNLGPAAGVAAQGLTDFAMPSMPATSFMGMVMFPVVNL